MNILELDSYNLADAVKFNDRLNPALWGSDERLKPKVREQLLRIADDFREFLGVNDLQLKDITVSGSNAAYTYTPHSDIDLHLVVDLPEADRSEVYRELFDAKKYQYNDMHDIKIGGYDVELYVQDANKPHHSQGIYSVVNNDWVDVPKRRRPDVNDISTQSKYDDLSQRIDVAVKSGDFTTMSALAEKIRDMRQAGLDEHGEFGPENLAFKMLRSQGKIKELYDARNAARDQELSLKERRKPTRSVFTYGFKHESEVAEDAGETWDGVNPTTCMFLNEEDPEPTDEEILKDFIDFCVKELKINSIPTVKLRRDPQWSVVHKTFGRYINDKKMLEVAWGQRHIMDVLRTVAHELTHRHQHEREAVPPSAGETGSEYENEANARAGILMRDYAQLHPEFFAAEQAEELHGDELKEFAPSPDREDDDIPNQLVHLANRWWNNAEKQPQIENVLRSLGWSIHQVESEDDAVQLQHRDGTTYFISADDFDPEVFESASGYIPTKKQAKDPRWSMALTQDIKPGAVGLNANKLRLNTNRQGQPQIANTNGLVQRMKEQLEAFKQGIILENEVLDEVRMSPSALKKFAASPAAEGILVGFEAELIFPDVNTGEDMGEMEPDYDADERCRSVQQVIEFFEYDEYGYGISGRDAERLQEQLDEAYFEWQDEQMMRDFKEEAEDLIKKVMIDEKDWVQENEVRKQLDMMEITGADQEAVLAAGSRAPRFNSTKEQQAYTEEHPEYEKYVEALEQAEGLLDDLVQDSVSAQDKYWDAAIDDFRDDYYVSDDSGFFDDVGLRYMSDVANRFDVYWPYMNFEGGSGTQDIDSVAESLADVIDMPVIASSGYHSATRKPGQFIVEPDGSLSPDDSNDGGLEIISPPMPIVQAMEKLNQVIEWAQARGCYTNSSTGLHMGVSLPGQNSFAEAEGDAEPAPATEKPIDFMKLALFLGDQHVLKEFERQANSYCRSSLEKLKEKKWSPQQIATAMEKMRGNLINLAYKDLADRSPGRDSINMKDNYVEFRGAGGDYLSKESDRGMDFLENTLLRYVQALAIAGDPTAHRDEYAKKLYKLISPEGDDTLNLFSQFATGEISSEQLKKDWAKRTLEKDSPESVVKGEWIVINTVTGKPVEGQSYNGYTKQEVYDKAKQKLSPASSDTDFKQSYEIMPQNTGKWEIYTKDSDTGKEEALEIVDAERRGQAIDKVSNKYLPHIQIFARPYYGDAKAGLEKEPTRRAKLAKKIIQQPAEEIKNWIVYDTVTGEEHYNQPGRKSRLVQTMRDMEIREKLPRGRLAIKLSDNQDIPPQEKEVKPNVAQNFTAQQGEQEVDGTGEPIWEIYQVGNGLVMSSFTAADQQEAADALQDQLNDWGTDDDVRELYAVRPKMATTETTPPDATEQTGTWQLVDVTLNQPVETYQGTWAEADRIATQYETGPGEHNGHEISVRGA